MPGRAIAGFGEALSQASPIAVRYDNRARDAATARTNSLEAQTKLLQKKLEYEKALKELEAAEASAKSQ